MNLMMEVVSMGVESMAPFFTCGPTRMVGMRLPDQTDHPSPDL